MTSGSRASALRQIGTLFGTGTVAGLSDGQLLERFLTRRDEGAEIAFAALVARHGPMVLGVCRRALPDRSDAEDAFQATFLILVRKARTVRVDDSLGRWLYGVSRKVVARARAESARRPRHDPGRLGSIEAPRADPDRLEVKATIDEELARLPESYRSAIVLCDLGGFSIEEAARDLGCPVGTIKSRLSRGRARLKTSLERRGLAPSFAMAIPTVPARLLEAASRASVLSTVGGASAAGLVPASAALLAEGMLQTMTGIKIKIAASALMTLGLAITGAGVMARQDKGDEVQSDTADSWAHIPTAKSPVETKMQEEVEKKLLKLVTIHCSNQPLSEVLQVLGRSIDLSIIIDRKGLTKIGLTHQVPVSITAQDIKLMAALSILLRPLGLTYRIEADVLLITTPASDRDSRLPGQISELERLHERLDQIQKLARDPADPAIIRVRKEVDSRIEELRSIMIRDQMESSLTKPADTTLKPVPAATKAEVGAPPREFAKVSMPDYVVEPPDIIVVEVLEALPGRPITGERLVKPDGKISLGFYGEIYVAGLTTTEIKEKIVLHLREYVSDEKLGLVSVDPETGETKKTPPRETDRVFVDVTTFNSKVYYVQGEVGSPGRLPITGNETVLDAINYAGGLQPTSAKDNIRLIRPGKPGGEGEQILSVDYDAIVHKGDSKTNYQLFPGDRLIVYRDPTAKVAPDVEARLKTVEDKLDEILKVLEKLPKAEAPPE